MEPEGGRPRRNAPLAPLDGFRVNLDAIVAAAQVVCEAEREIADPGFDVEQPGPAAARG